MKKIKQKLEDPEDRKTEALVRMLFATHGQRRRDILRSFFEAAARAGASEAQDRIAQLEGNAQQCLTFLHELLDETKYDLTAVTKRRSEKARELLDALQSAA